MAQNQPQAEKDPEVAIASAIGRVEAFIMRNSRSLLTALGVVIIVVGGFFGYKYLVAVPRMEKASAMMFAAEQQFAQDSFKLALNGDGNFAGFLQVIEKYGSTGTGNVARHYAGICYLRLGQYQEALDYLTQYKGSTDDVPSALLAAQILFENGFDVRVGRRFVFAPGHFHPLVGTEHGRAAELDDPIDQFDGVRQFFVGMLEHFRFDFAAHRAFRDARAYPILVVGQPLFAQGGVKHFDQFLNIEV